MSVAFGEGGRAIYGERIVLAPSATRTTNDSGPVRPTRTNETVRLTLNVTAASGTTPSLTVNVQTSEDGSSDWTTVDSFAAKTAVSSERLVVSGLDSYVRASWTMTGTTPSFTFSVAGQAV